CDIECAAVIAKSGRTVVRITRDPAVLSRGTSQDISGVAPRIDASIAAIGSVQWIRGSSLNAKTKKNDSICIRGNRGINEHRTIEGRSIAGISDQARVKTLLHRN